MQAQIVLDRDGTDDVLTLPGPASGSDLYRVAHTEKWGQGRIFAEDGVYVRHHPTATAGAGRYTFTKARRPRQGQNVEREHNAAAQQMGQDLAELGANSTDMVQALSGRHGCHMLRPGPWPFHNLPGGDVSPTIAFCRGNCRLCAAKAPSDVALSIAWLSTALRLQLADSDADEL